MKSTILSPHTRVLPFLLFLFVFTIGKSAVSDSLQAELSSATKEEKLALLKSAALEVWANDIEEGIEYGKQLRSLAHHLDSAEYEGWALNFIGVGFMRSGGPDSASFYYQQALDFAQEKGIREVEKKAILNLGINAQQTGNFQQALEYTLQALRIFEEIQDSLGLGHAHYNIGNNYFRLENYPKAEEHYLKAELFYKEKGSPFELANLYNGLGSLNMDQERFEEAIEFFNQAIEMKTSLGPEAWCAAEFNNLGTAYKAMKTPGKALGFLQRSIQAYEDLGDDHGQVSAIINLSELYAEENQPSKAIEYATQGLKKSEELQDHYFTARALRSLAIAHEAKGNSSQAYQYFRRFHHLDDSLSNTEVQSSIAGLEIKYETAKKEQQLAQQAADLALADIEAKEQDLILGLTLAGVLLLIITGIFLVIRNQQKQTSLKQAATLKLQEERLRISRDLHDNLGAELTLIASSIDNIAYKATDLTAKEKLEGIGDNARFAMTQLRESIWAIRRESATIADFATLVQQFAKKVSAQENMQVNASIEGELNQVLSPGQILNLYRISQEALNNAVKYSQATEVVLKGVANAGNMRLTISDNGKGFDPTSVQMGHGLKNMEARIKEIEGEFDIQSTLGKGTVLSFVFPLGSNNN